jgi:hypothetical protein
MKFCTGLYKTKSAVYMHVYIKILRCVSLIYTQTKPNINPIFAVYELCKQSFLISYNNDTNITVIS